MRDLHEQISLAAGNRVHILVRGETGTGKELVAKSIHQSSSRAGLNFVEVNCGALTETIMESQLFGHERGSFTGAQTRRIGYFERAHRGTILLDEIGDLSPNAQTKLLRVLQEHCIQRVGSTESVPIDARVVAATHRPLEAAIKSGTFREDLFYRLNGFTIWIPPLRSRLDDIPDLVRHFIDHYGLEFGFGTVSIDEDAIHFLKEQCWPGNVRQLENVTRQAMLLSHGRGISLQHAQKAYFGPPPATPVEDPSLSECFDTLLAAAAQGRITDAYRRMIETVEREFFAQAIRRARGNIAKVARWCGITRATVREKLARCGLRDSPWVEERPQTSNTTQCGGVDDSHSHEGAPMRDSPAVSHECFGPAGNLQNLFASEAPVRADPWLYFRTSRRWGSG